MFQWVIATIVALAVIATAQLRSSRDDDEIRVLEATLTPVVAMVDDVVLAMKVNQRRYGTLEVGYSVAGGMVVGLPDYTGTSPATYISQVRSIADKVVGHAEAGVSGAYAPGTTSLDTVSPNQKGSSPYNVPVGVGLTACSNSALAGSMASICPSPNKTYRVLLLEISPFLETAGANSASVLNLRRYREDLAARLAAKFGGLAKVDPGNPDRIYVNTGLL